jgi:hypothetical protein
VGNKGMYKGVLGPPLWSSGQTSRVQNQRSRVRFPTLPDFLSSSGSRTGAEYFRSCQDPNVRLEEASKFLMSGLKKLPRS